MLYQYLPEAPKIIIYDFACRCVLRVCVCIRCGCVCVPGEYCFRGLLFFSFPWNVQGKMRKTLTCLSSPQPTLSLSEYCLNREGSFYKDTRFFHDVRIGGEWCSCISFHVPIALQCPSFRIPSCQLALLSSHIPGVPLWEPQVCQGFPI